MLLHIYALLASPLKLRCNMNLAKAKVIDVILAVSLGHIKTLRVVIPLCS